MECTIKAYGYPEQEYPMQAIYGEANCLKRRAENRADKKGTVEPHL